MISNSTTWLRALGARFAPEFCGTHVPPVDRGRREGRVPAAPAAPVRKKCTGKEPQVEAEASGLPCAMVYGLYVLSPGTGLSCPRRSLGCSREPLSELDLSVGRPGPHDFTVRALPGRLAQRLRPGHSRPSHPASNVRDDREAPLMWRRDGEGKSQIAEKQKRNFFRARAGQPSRR